MKKNFTSSHKVCKVDESLGLVFGWGIICKVDGEPYVDKQNDHIPEDSMMKAALEFMMEGNIHKEMHKGGQKGHVVFTFPMTEEVAKAFGITTKQTGLMVGVRPTPEIFAKFKSGEYTGFSIGGNRIEDVSSDEVEE